MAKASSRPSETAAAKILERLSVDVTAIDEAMASLAQRRVEIAVSAVVDLARLEADLIFIDAARHPDADRRPVDAVGLTSRQDHVLAVLADRTPAAPFQLAGAGAEAVEELIRATFSERIPLLASTTYRGGLA